MVFLAGVYARAAEGAFFINDGLLVHQGDGRKGTGANAQPAANAFFFNDLDGAGHRLFPLSMAEQNTGGFEFGDEIFYVFRDAALENFTPGRFGGGENLDHLGG